jgi:hypothetical protein
VERVFSAGIFAAKIFVAAMDFGGFGSLPLRMVRWVVSIERDCGVYGIFVAKIHSLGA